MTETYANVRALVEAERVRISEHGYDELAADGISVREVIAGIREADVVEDYPTYPKGPCVLLLQKDAENQPIHVVWGIPKDHTEPAVLVTAYRPTPELWDENFLRRRNDE